jgi:hypothetical protein
MRRPWCLLIWNSSSAAWCFSGKKKGKLVQARKKIDGRNELQCGD